MSYFILHYALTTVERSKRDFVPPGSVSIAALIIDSISNNAPTNVEIPRSGFVPLISVDIASWWQI